MTRIGVDLGGTKTEVVVLDESKTIVLRRRSPTPRGNYFAILENLVSLVRSACADAGVELCRCSIGVGIPGIISPATGLVKNANTVELNGRRLLEDLQERLQQPVRIANDANCFALSEALDGAATEAGFEHSAPCLFGVILGTGVGGGVVVRGRLWEGADHIAGEWGHNPLPWMNEEEFPGPPCWCGRSGCIESFLSGPALSAEYQRQFDDLMDASQIARRALQGDERAGLVLKTYCSRLARALSSVINLLNPDVIVLGGGLSAISSLYEEVPRQWGAYVFSDVTTTRLLRARHGDSSGVRGAAWLW